MTKSTITRTIHRVTNCDLEDIDDKLVKRVSRLLSKEKSDLVAVQLCVEGILKDRNIHNSMALVQYRLGRNWLYLVTNAVKIGEKWQRYTHKGAVHYPCKEPGGGPTWSGIHEEPAVALLIAVLKAVENGF